MAPFRLPALTSGPRPASCPDASRACVRVFLCHLLAGLDGIITTFAIVASAVGATLSIEVIILSGFAKLLGDGLAMGLGDCMSEQAEHKHIKGEHAREAWEYASYPAGEKAEMIELYKEKGFSEDEATRIIGIMTSKPEYAEYFVSHMLTMELGHTLPDEGDNPIKDGGVTFASFMVFGSVPLWVYLIAWGAGYADHGGLFGIAIAVTLVCLFVLGALQAWIIKQNVWKQGAVMTFNGGVAAAAAYLIGWGLQQSVGGC